MNFYLNILTTTIKIANGGKKKKYSKSKSTIIKFNR